MSAFTLESRLDGAVGGKTASALERAFGMRTVGDLLAHYPRRYARRGELTPDLVAPGRRARDDRRRGAPRQRAPHAEPQGLDPRGRDQRRPGRAVAHVLQPVVARERPPPGRRGIFAGKVGEYRGAKQLAHPDYELFDDEETARLTAEANANLPIPIYPATSTIASWQLKKIIDLVLDGLGPVADPLPDELRARHGLLDARTAIERIHRPDFEEQIEQARSTLRMHEAFVLQVALLQQRQFVRALSATRREPGALLERFDAALPFARTPDQLSVGDQIARDLEGDWPMNRLVQGEVGSGKTLVALRAMLQVAESGGQSALIAPTEVLAGQHLRSIARMLGPRARARAHAHPAHRAAAGRRAPQGGAADGLGAGAHRRRDARAPERHTTFADLGLVVVDEQHRFGVEQREALRAKGSAPHALVLTATPIPRTVAMTVFGDLDVSTIRTMPEGRAGIETFVAPLAEKPAWFARVWERIAEEVGAGPAGVHRVRRDRRRGVRQGRHRRRAGRASRARPRARAGASSRSPTCCRGIPPSPTCASRPCTARCRPTRRTPIMQAFARGDIDVLVATTVVEVGVDVPNASTMVILEADRFGVSQLHQLRGRVGRGGVPGLCLLVTEAPAGTPARERVDAVAATLDGFDLAEVDLELRGEGDVLGDAQSGARSSLRLLRVVKDADLIADARVAAEQVLEEDPALPRHPGLAAALERRVGMEERAALAKN